MTEGLILGSRVYRFCLWKAYFERGEGLTRYVKYIIGFFGVATLDLYSTMVFAAAYFIFCIFLGRWWFLSGFTMMEMEVGNNFNLFVKEMREEYKKKVG